MIQALPRVISQNIKYTRAAMIVRTHFKVELICCRVVTLKCHVFISLQPQKDTSRLKCEFCVRISSSTASSGN